MILHTLMDYTHDSTHVVLQSLLKYENIEAWDTCFHSCDIDCFDGNGSIPYLQVILYFWNRGNQEDES